MQSNDNGHGRKDLIGPSHTFMGASVGFRLLVASSCLILLWLCVGWAISA